MFLVASRQYSHAVSRNGGGCRGPCEDWLPADMASCLNFALRMRKGRHVRMLVWLYTNSESA